MQKRFCDACETQIEPCTLDYVQRQSLTSLGDGSRNFGFEVKHHYGAEYCTGCLADVLEKGAARLRSDEERRQQANAAAKAHYSPTPKGVSYGRS